MHSITLNNLTTNQIAAIIAALGNDSYTQQVRTAEAPLTQPKCEFTASAASEVPPAAPAPTPNFGAVLGALNDERYTLRTAAALVEAGGYADTAELMAALNSSLINITTQRRRSDDALLIGLGSRN